MSIAHMLGFTFFFIGAGLVIGSMWALVINPSVNNLINFIIVGIVYFAIVSSLLDAQKEES